MKSFASVLVCLALAGLSHAFVDVGECPTFSPVSEFDPEQGFGRWFEIQRFEAAPEEGLTCVGADVAPGHMGMGSIDVHEFATAPDGTEVMGNFEVLLTDVPGELEIVKPDGDNIFSYIIGTDYVTYGCTYRCTQDGEFRDQFAMILSTTPELDAASLEAALATFEANGVDTSLFLPPTPQTGCTYPPEPTEAP